MRPQLSSVSNGYYAYVINKIESKTIIYKKRNVVLNGWAIQLAIKEKIREGVQR